MVKANPNWTRNRSLPVDWHFRIRGTNLDGDIVTLGRFMEEKEATFHFNQLVGEGRYHNLSVQRLNPHAPESGSDDPVVRR